MARIRRKSYDNIRSQAARIVSRLSGGYGQPLNYYGNKVDVDREIYDSPQARRNQRRIERVVNAANRYTDNIAKVSPRVNEPYQNKEQYTKVIQERQTKYPNFTYMNNQVPTRPKSNQQSKGNANT